MPLAQLRPDYEPTPAPAPRAQGPITAIASPVHGLQDRLEQHHTVAGELAKWSPRKSLAFIVTASAALWMAILVSSAEAVKVIA